MRSSRGDVVANVAGKKVTCEKVKHRHVDISTVLQDSAPKKFASRVSTTSL